MYYSIFTIILPHTIAFYSELPWRQTSCIELSLCPLQPFPISASDVLSFSIPCLLYYHYLMLYYFVPSYHSPILPNSVNSIHVLFYPIVCNLYFYLILAHTISSSIPSCFTLYSIIICAILIPALSYHSWSGILSPHPHLFNFTLSVQHVSCILRSHVTVNLAATNPTTSHSIPPYFMFTIWSPLSRFYAYSLQFRNGTPLKRTSIRFNVYGTLSPENHLIFFDAHFISNLWLSSPKSESFERSLRSNRTSSSFIVHSSSIRLPI